MGFGTAGNGAASGCMRVAAGMSRIRISPADRKKICGLARSEYRWHFRLFPMIAIRISSALLLGLGLLFAAGCAKSAATPTVAPGWKLQDLAGKPVSSEDFKGKVVVVDFWATWCPPCREEIPGYIALQEKYGPQGLVIVGVSLDQAGPEVVKAFAAKAGINYPLVMGDDKIVTDFGGVEGIPTTFLIDRRGQVRDRKVGMEPKETYEKKILAVLGEKA